ncbi:MAG: 23S rRNA (adenine(2503)-C(2))-methyltransferase RlmN [Gammaproteobacteria bacterium]|nr:23S rRNA (adenine(2503)-C(2))-methyltransferase RlmN [Gammaproteobacteria bacterium]
MADVRPDRANLLGMPRRELAGFFTDLGEKPYRATQVMKWLYRAGTADFDAMTDIGKALRARLKEVAEIRAPELNLVDRAGDGVVKWLASVGQSRAVETVLIPESPQPGSARGHPSQEESPQPGSARGHPSQEESPQPGSARGHPSQNEYPAKRNTLCISVQVGCSLDCSFCATGKQGFSGNLTRAEIVGQVWRAAAESSTEGRRITNVVFMGMGEPLLNFDATMDAADVFMDDLGFGISKRRVTISTAGVVPGIYDLADRSDVSLAVSLHAARDELRNRLVPINRKYPIAELLAACRYYLARVGDRRPITFEYTLIEGVNDTLADARDLVALLRDWRCMVNLIPFNPFPVTGGLPTYRRPSAARVAAFQRALLDGGLVAMLRTTRGDDIAAACGQLTGDFDDRTRRRARYGLPEAVRFVDRGAA